MRNVPIHGYFAIDTEIVWLAVTRDVPALTPTIERLRATLEPPTRGTLHKADRPALHRWPHHHLELAS
jgi:hypothetical protein